MTKIVAEMYVSSVKIAVKTQLKALSCVLTAIFTSFYDICITQRGCLTSKYVSASDAAEILCTEVKIPYKNYAPAGIMLC